MKPAYGKTEKWITKDAKDIKTKLYVPSLEKSRTMIPKAPNTESNLSLYTKIYIPSLNHQTNHKNGQSRLSML